MVSSLDNIKIYDCFIFFDETMLLELRLNLLNRYVDKFVIVECAFNHRGQRKNFNFKINKFRKFKKKIIYIKVYKKPKNLFKLKTKDNYNDISSKNILNGYIWDNFQRNNILQGLKKAKNEDIIIVSDIDEIPNLKNNDLKKVKEKIIFFKQKIFFYKFNLQYPSKYWFGSRACKKKFLISPQWLRDIKAKKFHFWRIDTVFSKKKYLNTNFIDNGGWHFTNIKSPNEIFKKLNSYAHWYEFNLNKLSKKNINNFFRRRLAIYNLDIDKTKSLSRFKAVIKLKKKSFKVLPDFIIENKKKYKKWLAN